ncbi:MAG: phosphoglycerate kinase [Alphaproteobacteria bacterium]|nr:phosphoglycerate kinase [Alphaproteobacteria bacterium]
MNITKNDLRGKKVLVRVDFNVPLNDGIVQDTARIKNVNSTIRYLQESGAKIILMSHLGKTALPNPNQSLRLLKKQVEEEFRSKIVFIDDCVAENAANIIDSASVDDIIMLENLRFHSEEEDCNEEFAKKLASLADFYINEAFSVSHRKHASIFAVPKFLPHALGFAFKKEVQVVDNFFQNAASPKMCIIGGSKLSTKIKLLKNLVKKVDKLALGGGIAGAFLAFLGNGALKIFDPKEYRDDVVEIIENAKEHHCALIMPTDFSALISDRDTIEHSIISSEESNASIFDIGPESVELFKRHINESKVVLWNGPVGLFEKAPFDFGTRILAEHIAQRTRENHLTSVIGGGDTGFAMKKFKVCHDMTYISTAGGAFLSYLEGSELAGITAMQDAYTLE